MGERRWCEVERRPELSHCQGDRSVAVGQPRPCRWPSIDGEAEEMPGDGGNGAANEKVERDGAKPAAKHRDADAVAKNRGELPLLKDPLQGEPRHELCLRERRGRLDQKPLSTARALRHGELSAILRCSLPERAELSPLHLEAREACAAEFD